MGTRGKGDAILMPMIELGGQTIDYSMRGSSRAKRISIRFDHSRGFVLVYPDSMRHIDPEAIFLHKQKWVLKTLANAQAGEQHTMLPRRYEHGATIPYFGKSFPIRILVEASAEEISISKHSCQFLVAVPRQLSVVEDALKCAFIDYYRVQAQEFLPNRTEYLAEQHGFHFHQLRVKHQRTRWGSCSAKGNLNFNLRLMMAPPAAIDSVILHELCHLQVLNHSDAFWNLLEKLCPDYRDWQKWFKDNGNLLVF